MAYSFVVRIVEVLLAGTKSDLILRVLAESEAAFPSTRGWTMMRPICSMQRGRRSPVGFLILRQNVYVMFHHISFC